MTGKEKCELLRSIRKEIADRNGIIFEPSECNHRGDCSGTCPLCDSKPQRYYYGLFRLRNHHVIEKYNFSNSSFYPL